MRALRRVCGRVGGGWPFLGVLFGLADPPCLRLGSKLSSEAGLASSPRFRLSPLPPMGVPAEGNQTAKFIASCLLGQMKMEVKVLLRAGCRADPCSVVGVVVVAVVLLLCCCCSAVAEV